MKTVDVLSIITVVYNAAEQIERTVRSVLEQEYPNLEYLVIDGGSSDGTAEIIERYADRIAYCVSEPDGGVYDAMNKGIAAATGKWVHFLNAGDTFTAPDSVSKVMEAIAPETDIAVGGLRVLDASGSLIAEKRFEGIETITSHNPCYHQATFAKRELIRRYPFDTRYRLLADYDFVFTCHQSGCRFQELDFPVADYLAGGMSDAHQTRAAIEGLEILSRHTPDEALIFESRWYALLQKRAALTHQIEALKQRYSQIAVYGYGTLGKEAAALLGDKVSLIVDRYRSGSGIARPEALMDAGYDAVLVTVTEHEEEVVRYLVEELGVDAKSVVTLGKLPA